MRNIFRKHLSVKKLSWFAIYVFLIIGGCACVYFWQHNQVVKSAKQIIGLQSSNAVNSKENEKLTSQLNKANQTINNLTQTNSFTSGAACETPQLTLETEGHTIGAAGNRYQMFSYQNISKSPCTVQGLPGFLALDSSGYVIPDGPIKEYGTGVKHNLVTLNPQEKAYFLLHWGATGLYPNEKCINASLIESTPPGNMYPLVISVSINEVCSPGIDIGVLGSYTDYIDYLK